MPPSTEPPEFFVDRSLGRRVVEALKSGGCRVSTMADVYGPRQESITDHEWLAVAARRGWLIITKDHRIRRRPAQIEAVRRFGLRLFCITNPDLTGPEQSDRLLRNMNRIIELAQGPAPSIYAVYERGVRRLWP